jgi:hypothetical protein
VENDEWIKGAPEGTIEDIRQPDPDFSRTSWMDRQWHWRWETDASGVRIRVGVSLRRVLVAGFSESGSEAGLPDSETA